MRGSANAWANSQRLQAALAEARIAYRHEPALVPTTELRQLQYAADDRLGVGKRSRCKLDQGAQNSSPGRSIGIVNGRTSFARTSSPRVPS